MNIDVHYKRNMSSWTRRLIAIAALMLVSGTANTPLLKLANRQHAIGRNGTSHRFRHPLVQTCCMFIGQGACIVAHYARRRRATNVAGTSFNPLLFWPAALCDMLATALSYIGLCMTQASSYMMMRGATVVFTALLSTFFLKNSTRLRATHWNGILLVLAGLIVVGASDMLMGEGDEIDEDEWRFMLIGDALVLFGQLFTSAQFVYQQAVLVKYDVDPLEAVG